LSGDIEKLLKADCNEFIQQLSNPNPKMEIECPVERQKTDAPKAKKLSVGFQFRYSFRQQLSHEQRTIATFGKTSGNKRATLR
jgi:hypothetical protein